MTFRTLGDLRGELQARVGMASAGSGAGANVALLNSHLRVGQKTLYNAQDWVKLKQKYDSTLGVNQFLVNYPATPTYATTADPERILKIEVNIGTTDSPQWRCVEPGITAAARDVHNNTGWPRYCEMFADQIELTPKNDVSRTLRIWAIREVSRFTQDNDPATLDDDLILLFATATIKAHYRQPDADLYATQMQDVLTALKGRSHTQRVYNRRDAGYVPPKPRTV